MVGEKNRFGNVKLPIRVGWKTGVCGATATAQANPRWLGLPERQNPLV
jgi:hypothetical protein